MLEETAQAMGHKSVLRALSIDSGYQQSLLIQQMMSQSMSPQKDSSEWDLIKWYSIAEDAKILDYAQQAQLANMELITSLSM